MRWYTEENKVVIPNVFYKVLKGKSTVATALVTHILESQRQVKDNTTAADKVRSKIIKLQSTIKKLDINNEALEDGTDEAKKVLLSQYGIDFDAIMVAEKL